MQQQQQISGLGNVGFSDADTGSWMNFFDSSSSSDQFQQNGNVNGQTAPGTRNAGAAFLTDLYGAGNGYEQPAAALPSPPSGKKVVIIDVAKFVKGKLKEETQKDSYQALTFLSFTVLTITGVCLGRTPGFKRQDVDRALAVSSFEAF